MVDAFGSTRLTLMPICRECAAAMVKLYEDVPVEDVPEDDIPF